MYLSIIIPAYNEEGRIGRTLKNYCRYFSKEYGDDFEIIVITDGCRDNTVEEILSIGSRHIRHYDFKRRLGKGGAISKGFKKAKGRIVTYTDADGSTSPRQLYDLIRILGIIECDGVLASRYMGGSKLLVKQPFTRRVASRGFNMLVRSMFGLPYADTQCGAKVFKRPVAKDISSKLSVTDWAFDVNLLYNACKKGYDVREIPIVWKDAEGSKLSVRKVAPFMFLSLVRLRLIESPFKGLVRNRFVKRMALRSKKRHDRRPGRKK